MKKYSVLAFGIISCSFILLSLSCKPDNKQSQISQDLNAGKQTPATVVNSPYGVNIPEPTASPEAIRMRDLQKKAIQTAEAELIAKYNISTTSEELLAYTKEKLKEPMAKMKDEDFQEILKNAKLQITASEAVVEGSMTAEKAAETYFPMDSIIYLPMLKQMNKKKLEGMRKMMPTSIEDMITKSVGGNKESLIRVKIMKALHPDIKTDEDLNNYPPFDKCMLDYARDNLLGKHPDFKNVSKQDIGLFK